MGLVVVTQPSAEPITLADAKLHLRQDDATDDALITGLISAARRQAEAFLNRPLITTGYRWTFDHFRGAHLSWFLHGFGASYFDRHDLILRTPKGGVQAVASIQYTDPDGTTQTLDPAAYIVDASEQPCRIAPAFGLSWPITQSVIAAVKIEFTAGYGDTADTIPADIIAALKLILGHLYENRENSVFQFTSVELPQGAEHLLWPHRVFDIRKG